MAKRGFIIAVENYEQVSEGLATHLPGTHANALAFRRWLIEHQGITESDIYFCAEAIELAGRTTGATGGEIVNEIDRLITEGQDETPQLYFYFAGHGFSYTDINSIGLADVLVAADYKNRLSARSACLSIDEIQRWLRRGLGPEDHFYFIDCCRTRVSAAQIKVSEIGPFDAASNGYPTVFTLYSTTEGETAAVESGFTDVLLKGLKGTGRAKVWHGAGMAVHFQSVRSYVRSSLTVQPVDSSADGSSEGLILEFIPPPAYACEVVVENADKADTFHLEIRDSRDHAIRSAEFTGPSWTFREVPDDYELQISAPGAEVVPVDPLPADLYQDCKVRFAKRAAFGPTSPQPPPGAPTTVLAPANSTVILRDLARGDEVRGTGEFNLVTAPGRYEVEVLDARGVLVRRDEVRIGARKPVTLDLSDFSRSPLRDALLTEIPGQHEHGAVDFSETLGPTPDQRLDFWLAIIGASRILLSDQDDFSKLGPLPLATFRDEPEGASSLYVLAGFDQPTTRLLVGVSDGVDGELTPCTSHPSFPGLFEVPFRDLLPGDHYLTLRLDDEAALTLPVCTLSNRATLVTASRDARRRDVVVLRQFVLPIPHLAHHLPYAAQRLSNGGPPLPVIRRLVELQRQFAESRNLADLLSDEELVNLLYVKWFEPLSCLLAAYELARRGQRHQLKVAVQNLRHFFPELLDTEAIAKRAGLKWTMPLRPPLVLDGLLELDLMPTMLPLPAEDLDYGATWTSWRRRSGIAAATFST